MGRPSGYSVEIADTIFVYALLDPRTADLRYIGVTKNPDRRLGQHSRLSNNRGRTKRANWLRSLLKSGLLPEMIILESGVSDWDEAERFWVSCWRTAGANLVNGNDGGKTLDHASFARTGRKLATPVREAQKAVRRMIAFAEKHEDQRMQERAVERHARLQEVIRRAEQRLGRAEAHRLINERLSQRFPSFGAVA
jgi:hypothetical protein